MISSYCFCCLTNSVKLNDIQLAIIKNDSKTGKMYIWEAKTRQWWRFLFENDKEWIDQNIRFIQSSDQLIVLSQEYHLLHNYPKSMNLEKLMML